MSSNSTFNRIQRIYGVDFGMRNISISKVDLDLSPFTSGSRSKASFLTDQIGKTTIFNGVQHIDSSDSDAMSVYKLRKMGNECNRSKPIHSIQYLTDHAPDFSIDQKMPNGDSVMIDGEIAMMSIVTHIRELIDRDMESDPVTNTGSDLTSMVVFALPELTPFKRMITRWRIEQIFNIEDSPQYDLAFMTDTNAVAFARFNQAYPNYINQETETSSSSETIIILESGHTSTEIMEVCTEYHDLRSVHRVKILRRLKVPIGGRTLDRKISRIIGKIETSKEVENIKHNLSMYESTYYDGENGRIKISHSDLMDDEISFNLEELQDFILLGGEKPIIEIVGGNARSFMIQDLLKTLGPNTSIRRGLSSNETTALGAAIHGAAMIISGHNGRRIEFDRCSGPEVLVRSPCLNDNQIVTGYYEQSIKFDTTRLDLNGEQNTSLKMMRARDANITLKNESIQSEMRMLTIKASDSPNLLQFEDLSIEIGVAGYEERRHPDFAADLFVRLDLLDLPEVVGVTRPGSTLNSLSHSLSYGLDERTGYSASDVQLEAELRHYQRLYERIGTLYNQMEAFYFDREGYDAKKQSILNEVNRIKNSYAYNQSSIDRMMAEYKNLLDTYEFCRIVTVDTDLLDEQMYQPDPEIAIDSRLTRERVDSIIRDEKGLDMLESMMSSV
jgi:hypothetical protein